MSALPSLWLPGSTQTQLPAVLAIELRHEVEAVGAHVPVRRRPVGRAVLVPGDRRAEARFLHEGHLVVGHEIVAQDRRRHASSPGWP